MGAEWYIVDCNEEVFEWLMGHNCARYVSQDKRRMIVSPELYGLLCLRYG